MTRWFWLLPLLVVAVMPQGCRQDADSFFSGRPSGMAMAHNRVLDGTPESMLALMRIPQRFPDANETQRASWQESVVAWWNADTGRGRILATLPSLTPGERRSVEAWVSMRSASSREKIAATLDEVAGAMRAQRPQEVQSKEPIP
jgi:hypothetical protein